MRGKWYVYLACFLAGAVLALVVGYFATRGAGDKLNAAIDGYRATLTADYADRLIRIADLTAVGRASAGVIRDLRQGLADAQAAEDRRRRAEDRKSVV
jgi:ABC-type transport system involved in cytochrome bd biosynthesis fused ATPase/permease subunit